MKTNPVHACEINALPDYMGISTHTQTVATMHTTVLVKLLKNPANQNTLDIGYHAVTIQWQTSVKLEIRQQLITTWIQ